MATLAPTAFLQYFDNNGDPLAGGKVYTYEAGTTTPKVTYTDQSESTQNANPVILDANGRADIWLGTGNYKFVLYTSADVLVDTVDNIQGQSTGGVVSYDVSTNTSITEGYDRANVFCTSSPTLSLLPVADATDGFEFWVYNTGSGTVTIDPDGAETINNSSTLTLEAGEWAKISCDGDEWYAFEKEEIIGSLDIPGTSSSSASISLGEDTDNGSHVIRLRAPSAIAATATFTLPGVDGGASSILSSDGAGVLSFLEQASQVEAEAGTASNVWMTPERVSQAITALVASGTVGASGEIEFDTIGLQVKWGTYAGGASSGTVSFGTAFPANCFVVVACANTLNRNTSITSKSTSSFNFSNFISSGGTADPTGFDWIAIGN